MDHFFSRNFTKWLEIAIYDGDLKRKTQIFAGSPLDNNYLSYIYQNNKPKGYDLV